VARGINASEVFHGSPFSPAGRISGPDPERQSYRSYAAFEDPDGNAWIVQEVTRRAPGRIDPATTTFASANDLASAMRRAAAAHGQHEKSRRCSLHTLTVSPSPWSWSPAPSVGARETWFEECEGYYEDYVCRGRAKRLLGRAWIFPLRRNLTPFNTTDRAVLRRER
jgi:hypothetical protein